CRPLVKSGTHGDVASEVADQRSHMSEPDAFAGLILRSGTPEQLEHALAILLGNAAPIVGHLDLDMVVASRASADPDAQGSAVRAELDRVVEQVAQNLLERQPVGDDG